MLLMLPNLSIQETFWSYCYRLWMKWLCTMLSMEYDLVISLCIKIVIVLGLKDANKNKNGIQKHNYTQAVLGIKIWLQSSYMLWYTSKLESVKEDIWIVEKGDLLEMHGGQWDKRCSRLNELEIGPWPGCCCCLNRWQHWTFSSDEEHPSSNAMLAKSFSKNGLTLITAERESIGSVGISMMIHSWTGKGDLRLF